MQTLGLNPTPRASEGFFRRLFYPTIRTEVDVDLAVRRGFWLCLICAAAISLLALSEPTDWLGVATVLLAGLGCRMRSPFAAGFVFAMALIYLATPGVFGITALIIAGILLANVRAIWIASKFPAAVPAEPQLGEPPLPPTWMDVVADVWVPALWPWLRWVFYVLAALTILGWGTLLMRGLRR